MYDKDFIFIIFIWIFKGVYFFWIYFKNGNKNFFFILYNF